MANAYHTVTLDQLDTRCINNIIHEHNCTVALVVHVTLTVQKAKTRNTLMTSSYGCYLHSGVNNPSTSCDV